MAPRRVPEIQQARLGGRIFIVQDLPLNSNAQDPDEQVSTCTSLCDHMYTTTQRLHPNTTYAVAHTNVQMSTAMSTLVFLHEQRG